MIRTSVHLESSEVISVTSDLQGVADSVRSIAAQQANSYRELLSLLRLLEQLHQEIRDQLFQPALPTSRQELYTLLRDIELAGGWPYIPRMKLQEFLSTVMTEPDDNLTGEAHVAESTQVH